MSKLDLKERHAAERARFPVPVPIVMQDETRDGADRRVLYVLGFGIAGAILTNVIVFVYFAAFYASG
jgi:hypothetical protein